MQESLAILSRLTPDERARLLDTLESGRFQYHKVYGMFSPVEHIDWVDWRTQSPDHTRPVCEDGRCPLEVATGADSSSEIAILRALANENWRKVDDDVYHEICQFITAWDTWKITPQELADAIRSLA